MSTSEQEEIVIKHAKLCVANKKIMFSDGTILQCVMHVHYTPKKYCDLFCQFLEQSPAGADKTVHSIDLDSSTLDQSTAFLESFKMGGYDEMTQVKDLHVTVDDPEKHVGGYVSYNVTTKVRFCKN